ncbi:TetR/AcrR family transcriptional regulator [Amycolatopsis sp. WQ 127309]|uniref:TetR/AcrR family transcriptional regulator n=1 Tax=Amycolatopsis sp. WQ 127309 TaxID=2932773 RepID=UPI001FF15078|nr:TetR family transcriptional regulator [Amycolatopsis sp. WQ 127309]UOZ05436.1 TetR family transcriptional regulator [Amycolatopsis sp. WQ 127309]
MTARDYRSSVRERHAQDTRRTILDAAAALFAERGYARTSVAAVAEAAGVAVNTVYTSVGGKPALVTALTEDGARDEEAVEAARVVTGCADVRAVVRVVAEGTGSVQRRRQRILAILLDNRTADRDVAAAADLAVRATRARLDVAAGRLVELGGLRAGLDRTRVGQILWFYFGFESWRTMWSFGWGLEQAACWLAGQAESALLDDRQDHEAV